MTNSRAGTGKIQDGNISKGQSQLEGDIIVHICNSLSIKINTDSNPWNNMGTYK